MKKAASQASPRQAEKSLGRSPATGKLVLKPIGKRSDLTVSEAEIRAAVREVIAGRKS